MSSIHSAYAQVSANKRFVAGASAHIYDDAGANPVSVAQYTALVDMGKTVQSAAGLLRKVAVLPTPDASPVYGTGYIFLTNIPAGQNIVSLF